MQFIGFYDYTVILTYLSLVSALLGMRFASQGRFGLAVGCLILSGVCDMFDGMVARSKKSRTADEKNFGIQLDSICDVIAFGVAPAVLLYFSGANTAIGVAALVFYVLCALIRLAFFNVLEIKRQMHEDGCAKEYRGLPVTSSSIVLPVVFLVGLALARGGQSGDCPCGASCDRFPVYSGFPDSEDRSGKGSVREKVRNT